MIEALYIHIPFCDNICSYCDFSKVLNNAVSQDDYVSLLIDEIKSYKIPDKSLKTIYIGGGTPSCLSLKNLKILLEFLNSHFYPVKEFTFEANPESLTEDKIELLSKYTVNRVSLGVQTVNTNLLKLLNRKHTIEDVKKCTLNLKKYNIENFNLDFIYGIPNSTLNDIENDLNFIKEVSPKHISFYSLQIEEGTMFYIKHINSLDDNELRKEYDFILDSLKKLGYNRYEVSNFSKPGFESLHNKTYWKDNNYYACGVSASGYIDNRRYTNTRSITNYLKGKRVQEEEIITSKESEFEYLMLNLRLVEGFKISSFNSRFKTDFLNKYQKELLDCKDDLIIEEDNIRIKENKIYVMDSILLKLLKEY